MKKLIILLGNKNLREKFAAHMEKLGAAKRVSLMEEPVRLVAQLMEAPAETYLDPEQSKKPFEAPTRISSKVLARLAPKLSLRILPISYAGELVKSPADVLDYLFNRMGNLHWGKAWLTEVFFYWYGPIKDGVHVMIDGDAQAEELVDKLGKYDAVTIGLEMVQKDGTKLDSAHPDSVQLVVAHSSGNRNFEQATVKLLNELKAIFAK
jgi:hypothetical protein